MKTSSILSKARRAVLILGAMAAWNGAAAAEKTMRSPQRHIHQQLHGPQGMLTRNRYRPNVKITKFRREGKTGEFSCEFSARSGFLDRIEIRSGQKILATAKFDRPVAKGTAKIKVDLSKAGSGKHSVRVWGWQGRQGYQSVHGESKSVKITN